MSSGTASRLAAARTLAGLLGERPLPIPGRQGERLEPRDARFAAELAHGVVRHLSRVDRAIEGASGKPPERISRPALAAARIGVYQLIFTPSVPAYAAVSASVELARALEPRTAGFVNWLLRRAGPESLAPPRREDFEDAAAWLAALHSFPPWLVRRWIARLGEDETGRLLEAMNEFPPPHVRVNPLRSPVDAARDALAAAGFDTTPGRYAPACLHVGGSGTLTETALFRDGALYLQDESSQLAALALAPRPGERILDACAGVGGKTTQIAELAGNAAAIVALDRDARRLALLGENAARLGARGIEARRGDLLDEATLAGERFDAVLLDAPCSALGTIPRHPEVKWAKRAADPRRLAATQLRLLERAAALLPPGGRVVYSTCSTEPEEGEEVIARFVAAHADFAAVDMAAAGPGASGILNAAELRTPEGFLRSWPHRHGIGAAFVALATRRH
ncbi:MAG TPA: 16S rRNA (cytosine(967)-C(5))-methyltransferase RsmB [bacterium]